MTTERRLHEQGNLAGQTVKRWWVITHPTGLGYGFGDDYGCDVVRVEAPNKKRARVEGLRALRKEYPSGAITDYDNPFAAIDRIEPDVCSHGSWEDQCDQCDAEYQAEFEKEMDIQKATGAES